MASQTGAAGSRKAAVATVQVTTRLRPCTLAWYSAALMQPIAIVCIGGLTYVTLLTLYVVPIIYDMLNRKELTVLTGEDLEEVKE